MPMLSNNVLQSVIDGLKAVTGRELSVLDAEGYVVASTSEDAPDLLTPEIRDFVSSRAESIVTEGRRFFRAEGENGDCYLIGAAENDEEALTAARIAASQLEGLMNAYRDKNVKESFIKTLLMDNMLLVDVYSRAQKLRIENNVPRAVYYVEAMNDHETNTSILEVLKGLFPGREKDFVTALDEKHIIVVKNVAEDSSRAAVEAVARTLSDMVSSEVMGRVRISIGSVVTDIKDIPRSYKEAKMAMEVGRIFYEDRYIINYNWLGIGRLIHQLPESLCRRYTDEIFDDFKITDLDEEMLTTVNKFFQNSLNISETSRQLYVHRNTLVYRLDKLQKNTGLDIRVFDDAITFKIALMVSKYMSYLEGQEL